MASSPTFNWRGELAEDARLILIVLERAGAGDGFDAADAGGDGLFADNFQYADVADAVNVRAAAKFLAVKAARRVGIGNGHHAHVVLGIFVAEKSERAGGQRIFQRGDVGFHGGVDADFVVHLLLDVAEFLRVDGAKCEKSKRRRSGEFSEPACLTCVPRALRSAALIRCVPL